VVTRLPEDERKAMGESARAYVRHQDYSILAKRLTQMLNDLNGESK